MLAVEGGGEVFGGERHGEGRLVAEARLVVDVFEERCLDDELLAVRTVGHPDVVVQAGGQLAVHFRCAVVGGDDDYGIVYARRPSVRNLSGVFACRPVYHDADVVFVDDLHLDFGYDVGGFGAVVVSAAFAGQQEAEQMNVVRRENAGGKLSVSPYSYLKQAEADGRFEQRVAEGAVYRRSRAGAAFVNQRLQLAVVAGEFVEQVGRHVPLRLMLRDEVDKVVDVAKLLVDTAVPLSNVGKYAFGNSAVRHRAERKGERDAVPGFGLKRIPSCGNFLRFLTSSSNFLQNSSVIQKISVILSFVSIVENIYLTF